MDENMQLQILKKDLQLLSDVNDDFLKHLIKSAKAMMDREGIINDDTYDYQYTVLHYAAFLFRKRAGKEIEMPRFLRYEMNNLLLSQKARL